MNKKHFINFIIVIFGFLLLSACGGAITTSSHGFVDGTLHAIILADTDDRTIGKSTAIDLQKITKLAQKIQYYTGLKLNDHQIYGNKLTYDGVMTILENLPVKANDVVLFYYAGHGYNPGNGEKWPRMHLKDYDLPLSAVFEEIQQKAPRLFLVIADTCNKHSSGKLILSQTREIENQQTQPRNYKRLFLDSRGYIIASGAKPGQYSWSNSQTGGFFTSQFEVSLYHGLASNRPPSWKTIMTNAKKEIQPAAGIKQTPQAEVRVSVSSSYNSEVVEEGENDLKFEWLLEQSPERDIKNKVWTP